MKIYKNELMKGYQYIKNNICLYFEHGIFQVNGFKDNIHFFESFDKFTEAKKFFNNQLK